MLSVGTGKGGIAAESAAVTGFGCTHALLDQLTGHEKSSLQQIGVDGETGLPMEQAHHVILTDVKLFCQAVHIQVFCSVLVDVSHPLQHPGVLRDHRMRIVGILSSALTADLHQQTQKIRIADQLTAIIFAG